MRERDIRPAVTLGLSLMGAARPAKGISGVGQILVLLYD